MALFFVLNGFVQYKQDFAVALKKNISRYIVPYFVLCCMNLVLWIFLCDIFGEKRYAAGRYILGILYSRGTTEWMPNCSPLWFLTAMFIALLLTNAIFKIKNKILITLATIGCLTCGILLDYFDAPKLPWNIDTAFVAVVLICFGMWIKHTSILEKKQLIPILAIIGLTAIYANPIAEVNFDNNEYGNPALMLAGALCVSMSLIILCHWIGESDNRINHYISWLGRHTVFIMGFDYFSNTVSQLLCSKIGLGNFVVIFIVKSILLSFGCLVWNRYINFLPEKANKYLRY